MQSQVALRDVAVTTAHFVSLHQITSHDFHARADAAAIAFHANRLDENRIIRVSIVVAQQLRRAVEIGDYQIDVAIVVDVAESDATTRMRIRQYLSKLRRHFSKRAVAIVVVQQTRLAITRKLWIDVTVRDENIYP